MANEKVQERLIEAYLDSISVVPTSIKPLTGGSANYVWRIQVDAARSDWRFVTQAMSMAVTSSDILPSVVAKHAEAFVAGNPSVAFSVDRMLFEAAALRLIPSHLPESASALRVRMPALYHVDENLHILLMADGGSRNLKEAYASLSRTQAQDIGHRLGQWLAMLHASTKTLDIGPNGNQIARNMYRYSSAGLERTLQQWGLDVDFPGLGILVNETYGCMLATDDDCICMGDFWPGNVILGDSASPYQDLPDCTLVDWELVRRGCGATDVGQFVAEAYLLDQFRPIDHGLASSFISSYLAAATELGSPPTAEFLTRIGVHCGTHLAFWPSRVRWADDAATRAVAKYGVEMMTMAMAGDHKWLDGLFLPSTERANVYRSPPTEDHQQT